MELEDKRKLAKIEQDVNDIKKALLGDDVLGIKGFKSRVDCLEVEIAELKIAMLTQQNFKLTSGIYHKIIIYLATALMGSWIAWYFSHLK